MGGAKVIIHATGSYLQGPIWFMHEVRHLTGDASKGSLLIKVDFTFSQSGSVNRAVSYNEYTFRARLIGHKGAKPSYPHTLFAQTYTNTKKQIRLQPCNLT